jgi:hypothetical protein
MNVGGDGPLQHATSGKSSATVGADDMHKLGEFACDMHTESTELLIR